MANAKLTAVIDADTTPLTSGISKAMGSLRSFLTLGALAGAARQAIAYGSAINDAGAKTGVGVKWLQATAYAAKMAGSSLEELTTGLVELRRAQAQALGGSASDVAAFAQLGISLETLKNSGTEALFDRISNAVQRTGGGLQETNAALQVLGRGGRGLLGGMIQGFDAARANAEKFGLILSDSVIASMDELGDRLDTLSLGFTAFSAVVLKNMMNLQQWVDTARLVWTFMDTVNLGTNVRLLLKNPQTYPAEMAGRLAAMSGIIDSQSGGDDAKASGKVSATSSPVFKGDRTKIAASDELARIGGYVGGSGLGAGGSLIQVQNNALGELKRMRGFLEKLANRQPGELVTW